MSLNLVDRYAFVPAPERCWDIAVEGGLRLSPECKVQALIHAARMTEADWRFIGEREHWIHIRRLMFSTVRGDEFGTLIAAIAAGRSEQEITAVAEQLVRLT